MEGGLEDGTELPIPADAMHVQIEGTPVVLIGITEPKGFVRIPRVLSDMLVSSRRTVEVLGPYTRY
jgi:hypothetical protein